MIAGVAQFKSQVTARAATRPSSKMAKKEDVTSAFTCSAVRTTVQVGPDLAMSARQSGESAPSTSPSDRESSNCPDVTEAGLDATSAWASSERPNDRAGVIVSLATGSGRCGMAREEAFDLLMSRLQRSLCIITSGCLALCSLPLCFLFL